MENTETIVVNNVKPKVKTNYFVKNKAFTSTFVFFVSAFLFLIIKILSSFGCFNFMGETGGIIINAFIQIGLMFLLPLFLYSLLSKTKIKKTFNTFQFKYCSLKTILTSFLLGVFVYFAVVLISTFCASFWHLIGYRSPSIPTTPTAPDTSVLTGLLLPILTTAILPAFCEEFANRGLLLNGLLTENNARRSILFTAICFGLLHYNINQAIYAVFVGLVVGSLVYYTKSIFPAMIVHFTNNFLATYFGWASDANAFGGAFNQLLSSLLSGSFVGVFIKSMLVILFVGAGLILIMSEIYRQTRKVRLYENLSQIAVDYFGEGQNGKNYVTFDEQQSSVKKQKYEGEVFVKMQEEVFKSMMIEREQKSFIDKIVPKAPQKKKTFIWQDLFLYLTIFMTGLLTIFTLIWGFL